MYMSQEMLNLRRFLARFLLCDNRMTIIILLIHRYNIVFLFLKNHMMHRRV